jgi:RHS repeat-associated protein
MLPVQERTSAGHPAVTYTRGLDMGSAGASPARAGAFAGSFEGAGGIGGLLARTAHQSTSPYQPSTHAYYHADGNGNVTYLLNQDRSHGASYRYDPYGRQTTSTGPLASANLMRFSSKHWHDRSASYYYGYRFYLPEAQRWLNRDPLGEPGFELLRVRNQNPLGDGPNPYAFVHNNPVNVVDPFGDVAWGWPVVPPPGYPPTLPPGLGKLPIDPCLVDCVNKCATVHLPLRVLCAVGCTGTGPVYWSCFWACQKAVTYSQGLCIAACYAGEKI